MSAIIKKDLIIQDILSNSVYTEESGLRKNLHKELLKLSVSALSNFRIILDIKVSDAVRKGMLK